MNLLKGNILKMKSLIILFSLLVISCGGNQPQGQANDVKYINTPSNYVKPGASIRLVNTEVVLANTDVEYNINMAINSGYFTGVMSLILKGSDGLNLNGDLQQTITLTQGNIDIPLTVMANEPGRYYIYANAQVNLGGQISGRALAFIVNIGKFNPTQISEKAQTTIKNGIIELKAKEEIIK